MSLLALTMGEPGGIGPELALRAWTHLHDKSAYAFTVIADANVMAARNQRFGCKIPMKIVDFEQAKAIFPTHLPIIPLTETVIDRPGEAEAENAAAVIASIRRAVAAVIDGKASAIVTNPIQKSSLYAAGFSFPGHTEFLASLAGEATGSKIQPVMMLASDDIRVVPVTIHIPLSAVPAALTTALIVSTARIVTADLIRLFHISHPRLALAGLNPHAGEAGSIGTEDQTIIAPAIAALRALGIDARGPLPADTMFHAAARATYDAALCMYHDQALIPVKTLAFDRAVNVTLGLPFIRTSPDHGTALDIASLGKANPQSLISAIKYAATLAANTH